MALLMSLSGFKTNWIGSHKMRHSCNAHHVDFRLMVQQGLACDGLWSQKNLELFRVL